MNPVREHLLDLNQLDRQIAEREKDLEVKPASLNAAREKLERVRENIESHNLEKKKLKAAIHEKEVDIEAAKNEAQKIRGDLPKIKKNTDYALALDQIRKIGEKISVYEDEELAMMDRLDEAEGMTKDLNEQLKREEADFEKIRKELEAQIRKAQVEVDGLRGERAKIVPRVDAQLLRIYERLFSNFGPSAIVPVHGRTSCGGCFMNLTSQTISRLLTNVEIVTCPSCGRILFFEEEVNQELVSTLNKSIKERSARKAKKKKTVRAAAVAEAETEEPEEDDGEGDEDDDEEGESEEGEGVEEESAS